MRQIFTAYPYISPREPEKIARWIREHGQRREVARGEVLKYGGEANRLFLVEKVFAPTMWQNRRAWRRLCRSCRLGEPLAT